MILQRLSFARRLFQKKTDSLALARIPQGQRGLNVEELEQRVMLSTVDITAYGQEGDEIFSLWVDGDYVEDYAVGTEASTFTYSSDETFSADRIRIEFANDSYLPDQGFDRNLIVDKIEVDGVVFETEDASVFGTGTWTGSGIVPGFNQTETLHTNGYFQYGEQLDALGFTWTRSDTTSGDAYQSQEGWLVLPGSEFSDTSVWTVVPIGGDQLYEFAFEAWRQLDAGVIEADGQPWASVGVDFYDASGNFISKLDVPVSGPSTPYAEGGYRESQVYAPEEAAFAGIWAWTQQTNSGTDIPLVVDFIALNPIFSPSDMTPPELTLQRSAITEPTNNLQFNVLLSDESGVELVSQTPFNELRITGPNGYSVEVNSIAGNGSLTSLTVFYELSDQFDASDNGEYTVSAIGQKFRDGVGNWVVDGTLVGTFVVDIPELVVG